MVSNSFFEKSSYFYSILNESDENMNYIDIILVLLLLFAAMNGYRRGLIAEVASLAALVLGIWGAIKFSHITTENLVRYFNLETGHLNIISFIVTFIVIVILVNLVGSSVNKLVEVAMLGFFNKLAGLAFGFLRTALILSIILLIFSKIDQDVHILSQKSKAESQLYEPIRKLAPSIFPFIKNWVNTDEANPENDPDMDTLKA
jgi:membrane protein required for colicin V production